jgi:hypothetical protein
VPNTLDANDMRFATLQGFNSGDHFFAYLRDSFDVLYAEGERAPKLMSVGLHCRLAGWRGGLPRSSVFSTTFKATTTCGSAAGSTSPAIGARSIPPDKGAGVHPRGGVDTSSCLNGDPHHIAGLFRFRN